ncbi:hypothetical protein IE368CO2PC_00137 [Enterococcus faecalis]|nr:restriction endonuclease subunit S [Listeria monocytogenes]CAC9706257.1 hypothetical protein IE368CO2PC_00137 [Enterococcus faecalis]CAC9706881.1 hypothetical protein IE368AEPC_00103 [Enterococcus faecalis]CAC9707922.1 hypothetical protein IE188HC_00137 [Enterococcus faecalis]CAC9707955.1 hypothetical protein IE368AEGC_00103 [Enterococcus faecalis]
MVTYPSDWKEYKINDVADIFDNLRIPVTKNQRKAGNIPYYGANGIQDYVSGYTHDGEFVLIAEDGANDLQNYPVTYTSGKIWVNNHAHVLAGVNSKADTRFLAYLLKTVDFSAVLVGGTRAKLNGKTLKNIEVTLPERLKEQQTIASVLSDFHEHIDNLSELIEKKKAIRDGALEDLVSGRTRLDGFNGEWVEMTLEDICVPNGLVRGPFGGSLKKEMFVSKGNKVYEQRNAIYKSVRIGDYYISNGKYNELSRFAVKADDFIVSCSGTIGKIFKIPKQYKRGIINQALLKISIDQTKCNLNYFYKYFEWDKFQDSIIDNTQGGAMKNLVGMDIFRKTVILMPRDITEQKAIAQIISAMDEEIESLKIEKEKMIQIKEGAMDDLLTGRVRLNV